MPLEDRVGCHGSSANECAQYLRTQDRLVADQWEEVCDAGRATTHLESHYKTLCCDTMLFDVVVFDRRRTALVLE